MLHIITQDLNLHITHSSKHFEMLTSESLKCREQNINFGNIPNNRAWQDLHKAGNNLNVNHPL